MGYYAPTFANLTAGWYFKTTEPNYAVERDICLALWRPEFDEVLNEMLEHHGMFIMAFERDIKTKITSLYKEKFPFPRYFGYFYVSRILQNESMREKFISDYKKNGSNSFLCTNCNSEQKWDDIHPSIIGRTKKILGLCNNCSFWLSEIVSLESIASVPDDFKAWYSKMSNEQICPVCNKKHTWFKKSNQHEIGTYGIPWKYAEICLKCASTTIHNPNPKYSIEDSVIRFKLIAEILGSIPDRNGYIFNQAQSLDSAVEALKEVKRIHSIRDMIQHCGSWFKLLVASGILPDGTRKTHFGTMVIAKDGCQCLSLAEKDIDDKLFAHGIPHVKEPHYPDSNFRADWKISIDGKEVFIEFFGLHGDKNYNKRMKEKMDYAKTKNIDVIAFLPSDMNSLTSAFAEKILSRITASQPNTLLQPGPTDVVPT